jgi:hypothetical protein
MNMPNIIRAFRSAGIHTLTCPLAGCPYHDRAMSLQGWFNHLRGEHVDPRPMRACPHDGCGVVGRDPGMSVHIKSPR